MTTLLERQRHEAREGYCHMYYTEEEHKGVLIVTYARPVAVGHRLYWIGYVLAKPTFADILYRQYETGNCRTSHGATRTARAYVNDLKRRIDSDSVIGWGYNRPANA